MRITHNIILDVSKQGVQATVPITQHDAGVHQIVALLRNGTEAVVLTEEDSAALYIPDADIFDPVTVYTEESALPCRLAYDISAAASAKVGMRRAVFNVTDGRGMILYSPEIALSVRADLTEGSAVTTSPPYAAVIQAQRAAEDAAAEAEGFVEEAQAAVAEAEGFAEEAAKSVVEAETAVAGAADRILKEAKDYTDSELAALSIFRVVESLPEVGEADRIYLVPKDVTTANDVFDEYLWVNKGTEEAPEWVWEWFAAMQVEVDVDLSSYVKKTDYATGDSHGVISTNAFYGIHLTDNGVAMISLASNDEIKNRTTRYRPITPFNLDYAVQSAGDPRYVKQEDYVSGVAGMEERLGNLEAAAEGKLYTESVLCGESVANPYAADPTGVLPYMLLTKLGDIDGKLSPKFTYTLPESVGGVAIPASFREKYAHLCVGCRYFDLLGGVSKAEQFAGKYEFTQQESMEYEYGDGQGLWYVTVTVPDLVNVSPSELASFAFDGVDYREGVSYLGEGKFYFEHILYNAYDADEVAYVSMVNWSLNYALTVADTEDVAIDAGFDLYIDGAAAGDTISAGTAPGLELCYMTKTVS